MNSNAVSRSMFLRGSISLFFFALAIAIPGPAMVSLAIFFGAFVLVSGASLVSSALSLRKQSLPWGGAMAQGILGIIAGVGALFFPGITLAALVALVGVWAILSGLAELYAAIKMKWAEGRSRAAAALAGVLSTLLGVFLLARPVVGALTVLSVLAIYALMSGVFHIAVGVQVRSLMREREARVDEGRRAA